MQYYMRKPSQCVPMEGILSHTQVFPSCSSAHLSRGCNCGARANSLVLTSQSRKTAFSPELSLLCLLASALPQVLQRRRQDTMQALQSMARNYFTLSVLYGFFGFLSLYPQGALCGSLTCNPSSRRLESVQELVHRSEVVVEGKLQVDGQESAIYAQQTMDKVNKTKPEMMNDQIDEVLVPVPNRTSDLKPHHVRVRVHQVWEIKAGGLEKDSIVSLLWDSGDNCFTLRADTRYMFFMEPTNDTSVFAAAFPPVETRRAVRNDVSKVLCQGCGRCTLSCLFYD